MRGRRAKPPGDAPAPLRIGISSTPLGPVVFACSDRGMVRLEWLDEEGNCSPVPARLRAIPRGAEPEVMAPLLRRLADRIAIGCGADVWPLDLRGTRFQLRVWEALRAIPAGTTTTYGELARRLVVPGAARAVGAACGANPVAVPIPCHRAVRGDGDLRGYRWGLGRERALLDRERDAGGST